MTNAIINAAPMTIDYGTEDLSTKLLPREADLVPQHCPKFFIWAQKGPTEPQLVVGNERGLMFGKDTFNPLKKYHNHSTVFANLVNGEGNACMLQRLIPDDAGPQANLIIYIDVLPTQVDLYKRGTDGSIIKDPLTGKPILNGTAAGYKIKFVTDYHKSKAALADNYGKLTATVGNQVDSITGIKSTRYPIMELITSFFGDCGNLSAIRMWAPTLQTVAAMPTKLMNQELCYPFFLSVMRKESVNTSAKAVNTLMNESRIMFTFKPNVVDPSNGLRLNIEESFLEAYQNLNDVRYPKKFGDFGKIKVYNDNIDTILNQFFEAEKPFFDYESDFRMGYDGVYDSSLKHLINFLTLKDSRGNSYNTLLPVYDSSTTDPSISWSENSQVFARGGSDGTMNDELFAAKVSEEVKEYSNPESFLQELAVNVESVIYDTGFPLQTKQDLCDFISVRKDTFVILSTFDPLDPMTYLDPVRTETSMATSLKVFLRNYPESDYFGTPVMRGMIIGRNGKLRDYPYNKRLPLTAEVAIKSARYMGAGNGKWKNGFHFDGAPGSVIDHMTDINITWVSASNRVKLWDESINWVQPYDRKSFFFPALKTCYNDDTSVLNSYFTAMAICQLNKVAHAAWREFSGVSHYTNAQLAQRVNDFVITRTQNRFDGRFVIKPDAMFTDMDLLRGYSWTLPIKIFSPNMKTVMTTYVQAFRLDDLENGTV